MFEKFISDIEDRRNVSILVSLFCILSSVVFVGIVYATPDLTYTLSMFTFLILGVIFAYRSYLIHGKLIDLKETKSKIDELK